MSTIYWAVLPFHAMQCRGIQWSKECGSVPASSVPFVMDWRYKKELWTHYSCLVGAFPSSFPRDKCCYIMYKESANHVHTPDSDHEHCSHCQDLAAHFSPPSSASLFAPLINFCSVCVEECTTTRSLLSKWAFSHLWSWREVCIFFPISQKKKEKKCTWPGMLLMFLSINLSTSSVGYWIQYAFLCSNKLFKFLNIKGSKREI